MYGQAAKATPENGEKTIGLISKKATLHLQHTFLHISLPLFCTTTTWNFQKLFYGGNVVSVLVDFFFTAAHFLLALLAVSIVPAATKFSCWCCSSNKKKSPLFLSLALDLCRPFSRWVSLACRFFSVFLLLYIQLMKIDHRRPINIIDKYNRLLSIGFIRSILIMRVLLILSIFIGFPNVF